MVVEPMAWPAQNGPCRPDLHNLPQVHDRHAIGHIGRGSQIVGDVENGDAALVAQAQEQTQDLSPDGDVQHRYRLVGHQERRVEGQSAGDHHPLPLAP